MTVDRAFADPDPAAPDGTRAVVVVHRDRIGPGHHPLIAPEDEGEVLLELDDLDWRAGELVVCGKGRHQSRLPLPHDVGKAIDRIGVFRPEISADAELGDHLAGIEARVLTEVVRRRPRSRRVPSCPWHCHSLRRST